MRIGTNLAILCSFSCLAVITAADAQPIECTIPNELRQQWPWELISIDLPPGSLTADAVAVPVAEIIPMRRKRDEPGPDRQRQAIDAAAARPVQLETVTVDGEVRQRVWTIATVQGAMEEDRKGRRKRASAPLGQVLAVGPPPEDRTIEHLPLEVVETDTGYTISNGVGRWRLRGTQRFDPPVPLAEVPHWLAGLQLADAAGDLAAGVFHGDALVSAVTCELLQRGPVFVDLALRWQFAAAEEDGSVARRPLELHKQSFRWPTGMPPWEEVPRRSLAYELRLRIVAGDPWAEVVESFRLPDGHGYRIAIDFPADRPVDTAFYVPWFEYDVFGGNNRQRYLPAEPRPAQKGRPFAKLSPRWHQGGGGAQDFFLTTGGQENAPGNRDAPAVGVVASYASKWVRPQSLHCFVRAGERGVVCDLDQTSDRFWYGQRSYAICVGERHRFGNLNDLVNRHTDWTLTAQVNRYILRWDRDPAVAGANILTSRERLAELAAAAQPDASGPDAAIIQAYRASGHRDKDSDRLLALVTGEEVRRPGLPDPGMYFNTRYQDDSVNPTNFGNRVKVNRPFPMADLFSIGQPFGGAWQAAIGYIYTDLDAWPGWQQGWHPGNPNFHTDKYLAAGFAAAAMSDHPHADDWAAFALRNFQQDAERVLFAPDGVGYECPGYAGYALRLQLEQARAFINSGHGNPVADNPLFIRTAHWHRKLLTPPDQRIGSRHEAPHGDTHRWHSGLGPGFAELATFLVDDHPAEAAACVGTWEWLKAGGHPDHGGAHDLIHQLLEQDPAIPAADVHDLDWSSQAFHGFGAVFRHAFATPRESFLSIKAGITRGHYHNDEGAFHFYADATPISLDYNCSYHPRADHAALHNAVTFGRRGTVTHNKRGVEVAATEQLWGTHRPMAVALTPAADVLVSERSASGLTMYPIDPHDHEFHRRYPSRSTGRLVHRRLLALVKHAADSPFTDYLVVRDELAGPEPGQINLHLLARDLRPAEPAADGTVLIDATGQLGLDIRCAVVEATDLGIESDAYWYLGADDRTTGPGEPYLLGVDETPTAWQERLAALCAEHGVEHLPLPDWQPPQAPPKRGGDDDPAVQAARATAATFVDRVRQTGGQALQVPPLWQGPWPHGEVQQWLRLAVAPASTCTWLLCPYPRGAGAPTIERSVDEATGTLVITVTAADGSAQERIVCSSTAGIRLERDGVWQELIPPGVLPALGTVDDETEMRSFP